MNTIAMSRTPSQQPVTALPPSRWLLTSALALALIGTLSACGKSGGSNAESKQKAAGATATQASADPMVVDIKADATGPFPVKPLGMSALSTQLLLPGKIEANERQVTRIGAAVTGRVTEVLAEVGDAVRAGQTLASLTSPELTTAQLAYLRASSNAALAERAVDRARQLIQADVIGSAELQRREAELSIARAETRAAADQLRLLGVASNALANLKDQGSLQTVAAITATRAGVVMERKISQGQVAQPGDILFTVADLSNVWVVGALPEQTARDVQLGQSVEVDVPALGEQKITGKVVFISDVISPETRTVTIRTQLDNSKRLLKPEMLTTLRIATQVSQQLAVPKSAVVTEGDKDHVFVQQAPGRFRLTPVQLGAPSGDFRPVLGGVTAGTPVVHDGAFHLNNERKRAALN